MKYHRSARISSLIREELNGLLLKEIEFEGAVVTITDVAVSEKLKEAIVKISVYPSQKGPDVLFALVRRRPRLQFLLLRKINIKPMPKLVFQLETVVTPNSGSF